MQLAAAVTGAVAGLLAGPYLTVLITRVPAGENVLRPPGRCPRCGAVLRVADMIPLAGWLRLRGRCRACGGRIGAWYPAVELITGALFAVMGWRFGFVPVLPAVWYLVALSVALTVIDLRLQRLPDRLTLPSYPVAAVLLGVAGLVAPGVARHLAGALAGMAVTWVFYYLLLLIYPAGFGGGDVKLSGVIGLYLGWFGARELILGTMAAFVLAGLTGAVLLATRKATRKTLIPFGPFMLAAALTVIAVTGP
jgi:leader peptidase (prepilin peptidase) / N-methyltransferase